MPATLKLSVVLSDDSQCSTIWLAKSKGKWHAWLVDTTTPPPGEPLLEDEVTVQDVVASPVADERTGGTAVLLTAGPLTLC